MRKSRASGGGRKPTQIPNPFVYTDDFGEEINVLWDNERLDIRIEDILVGITRCFNAEKPASQEYVNWQKLIRIYRNVNSLTVTSIQNYLQCSTRTAQRYVRVIKLCNVFLEKHLKSPCTDIRGYIDITKAQLGYLDVIRITKT